MVGYNCFVESGTCRRGCSGKDFSLRFVSGLLQPERQTRGSHLQSSSQGNEKAFQKSQGNHVKISKDKFTHNFPNFYLA